MRERILFTVGAIAGYLAVTGSVALVAYLLSGCEPPALAVAPAPSAPVDGGSWFDAPCRWGYPSTHYAAAEKIIETVYVTDDLPGANAAEACVTGDLSPEHRLDPPDTTCRGLELTSAYGGVRAVCGHRVERYPIDSPAMLLSIEGEYSSAVRWTP